MENLSGAEQVPGIDYSMLEFDAIEQLRAGQRAELSTVGDAAVTELSNIEAFTIGSDVRKKAEAKLTSELDEKLEADLETKLDKQNDPALFYKVFDMLRGVSTQNMDSAKWYNGDKGLDGDYDYTTSGRYQADQLLLELQAQPEAPSTDEAQDNAPDNEDDTPESAEDLVDTEQTVSTLSPAERDVIQTEIYKNYGDIIKLRNEYAKWSVARRKLATSGGDTSQLGKNYLAAKQAYETCYNDIIVGHIKIGSADGKTQAELMQQSLPYLKKEHRDFTDAEYKHLTADESLRSRVVQRLAKRGHMLGLSIGSGAAIGVVGSLVGASLLATGAGGVLAGGLLAAKGVKGILLSKVRNETKLRNEFEKRRNADEAELDTYVKQDVSKLGTFNKPEEQAAAFSEVSRIVDRRVETDRNSNRRRVALGMFAGGLAAGVAYELTPVVSEALGKAEDYLETHLPGGLPLGKPDVDTPTVGAHTYPDSGSINSGPDTVAGHAATGTDHGVSHAHGDKFGNHTIDGVNNHYSVATGEGYDQVTLDAAHQMGAHNVNPHTLFAEFQHENPHTPVFTDNHSYAASDGPRISHAGASHYNPAFLHWLHEDLIEDGKLAA